MRKRPTLAETVRPGRFARPEPPDRQARPIPDRMPVVARLSAENYHLRCMVVELRNALSRAGAAEAAADIQARYFPLNRRAP